MGMDCVPLNNIEPFHCNWSGWAFLRRVLELSGADTSEMAWTNDGHLVRAETAMAWAQALRQKLADRGPSRLKIAKIPNKHFLGGYQEIPVVEFEKLPLETKVYLKLKDGTIASVFEQVKSYTVVETIFGNLRLNKNQIRITELDKDTRKFIREFADFCERSGGFHQF